MAQQFEQKLQASDALYKSKINECGTMCDAVIQASNALYKKVVDEFEKRNAVITELHRRGAESGPPAKRTCIDEATAHDTVAVAVGGAMEDVTDVQAAATTLVAMAEGKTSGEGGGAEEGATPSIVDQAQATPSKARKRKRR